jgi:hypothetical protein
VEDELKLAWRVSFDDLSLGYLDVAVDPQTGKIMYSKLIGSFEGTPP